MPQRPAVAPSHHHADSSVFLCVPPWVRAEGCLGTSGAQVTHVERSRPRTPSQDFQCLAFFPSSSLLPSSPVASHALEAM
jgi:hypothetical protein